MTRFLVDVMPKKAEECPFAEYIQMTSKNKCMLQTGMYSRCNLECGKECEKLTDVEEYIPPSFLKILTKHSDLFMKGLSNGLKTSEEFQKLNEDAIKLEQLSGYSLDKLIEIFAAGWTLEPPKKRCTVSELLKEFE